jgi:hypothetical protein
MRITKGRTAKPRRALVKHGEEIHDKRKLVQAVMQCGLSQRTSSQAGHRRLRLETSDPVEGSAYTDAAGVFEGDAGAAASSQ